MKRVKQNSFEHDETGIAVWFVRNLFLLGLAGVMVGLGITTFLILQKSETQLAETQYGSIVERALQKAATFSTQRLMATVSIASYVSEMVPDAEPWPFVTVKGFARLSTNLIKTSSGVAMAFAPIVQADQIEEFEEFAHKFIADTISSNQFPPPAQPVPPSQIPPPGTTPHPVAPDTFIHQGTGMSSFGKGIFGIDPNLDTPDRRYRRTDGNTTYGSPYDIVAPLLQDDLSGNPYLLYDLHSDPIRGTAIDQVIDCSHRITANHSDSECSVITDVLVLPNAYQRGPAAVIVQPVYPSNNRTMLTGFVVNQIIWDELLENLFADKVSGVDCVLHSEKAAFTYTVNKGVASFRGDGDLHEQQYHSSGCCVGITNNDLYYEGSPKYKLCLYPNSELYDSYRTKNPRIAAIGAVSTILFTSFLFFLYDFFVRRDVSAKKDLLQAKRRFMRFVSHEVRTPLSAVCMGLNVMQSEIASSLGFKSSDDLDDSIDKTKHLQEKKKKEKEDTTRSVAMKDVLEWYEMAKEVQGNTQNAVNVLNDLLNYDKIESGTMHLELAVVPIWQLIEQTVKEFKLAADRKQLKLEVSGCDDDGDDGNRKEETKLVGDAVRLSQVIRNLISNAIKFTPEHGSIEIQGKWVINEKGKKEGSMDRFVRKNGEEVSYCRSRASLLVSVHDTGAGMTQEQSKKLFRAGMQFNVNELQNGKGSGLGLYIAKGIVEQHNGRLYAESNGLGCGSTFVMELPLHFVSERSKLDPVLEMVSTDTGTSSDCEKEEVSQQRFVDEFVDESSKPSRPLRMLVVDDVPSVRKLLCRLLKKRGRVCVEAENGKEAVDKIRESMMMSLDGVLLYDAVLMDYEMPEMNGPDAAKLVREMGLDVFIVGITGNLLREDVDYFLSCGANAILPKPLNIDDLELLLVEHGISDCVAEVKSSPNAP